MKTQIKRFSKSTLAVILTICLLFSCMTVGIIATDAAKTTEERVGAVDNSESVGAITTDPTGYGFRGDNNSWGYTAFTRYRNTQLGYYYASSNGDFKITNTNTWDNDKTFSKKNTTLSTDRSSATQLVNGNDSNSGNITDGTTSAHYVCFVNSGSDGKKTTYSATTIPTSDESTIYIRNTADATDIRLYIYNPELYVWEDSPYILQNGVVQTGGENGWTVTELVETGGTVVYKVEGVYNAGNIIVRYGSNQSGDMTLTADASYDTASDDTRNTSYTPPTLSSHTVTAALADSTISTWSDDTTANKTVSGSGAITLPIVKSVGNHKFVNWTTSSSGATITNADKNDGTATVTVDNDNAVVTANFADSTTFMRYSTNPSDATSFVDVAIDTTEGATLRYTTAQPTFGYLFYDTNGASTESGYMWFKQSTNGDYAEPAHNNITDSTQFYAKTEVGNNYGKRNFSISIDAGVWKVRKVGIYDDTGIATGLYTLGYNFWKDSDVETEYYVAGMYEDGTANFFGTAWDPGLAANKMTSNGNGTYTKRFTSNIAGGTIVFKVVVNGDWDEGSYPSSGNQTQVIYSNSTWVQFDFNSSTGAITVTQDGSSGTATGWLYSGTAPASRTVVDPTSGMDALSNHSSHNAFRFMYGTDDKNLTTDLTPTLYYDGTSSKAYWAELTDAMSGKSQFFFGLCNYSNKGNLVGNNSEEINDATPSDGTDVTIEDTSGNTLFKIQRKQNNDVSSSARYVLIYDVDWTKVSAIGVKAWDNSQSTNSNNSHSGKVNYQIYYKGISGSDDDDDEVKLVDIYAKNGELRDSTFNRFTNLANTDIVGFSYTASNGTTYTSVSDYNGAMDTDIALNNNVSGYNSSYVTMTNVPVGAKITLRTYLSGDSSTTGSFNSTAFKNTHYLKAYSFNGTTYKVHTASELTTPGTSTYFSGEGYYEEEWTVRAVNLTGTKSNKTIEITPIYYMIDSTNTKTFYIDGYDGTVKNAWGNLLSVYPYYEGKSNSANAFGGYPGQPMLFWGGKYQMEVPLTVDGTSSGAQVKGLTLHNSYWDLLHRTLDTVCNNRNHAQTYDYDDFYKLNKEKNPDSIIFDFKYRTTSDNYGDGDGYTNYTFADGTTGAASTYNGSSYNGVELVTDYYGRQVDAFGTLISSSNQSDWDDTEVQDKELLFVSTGYKDTYVGEYATIWAVYAPQSDIPSGSGDSAGSFIGYISSSMLYLNNIGRVNQYTDGTNTNNGRMSWASFISTYNKLKSYYTGVPALISYEREIWNNSKDKANRSDGKWYYSFNTDKIEANIIIQYGSYSLLGQDVSDTTGWTTDDFSTTVTGTGGEYNVGNVTGCSAYFTNTSPYLVGKVESGEQFADNSSYFNFKAVPSGNYQFAGWVRYSGGKYYEITDQTEGQSNMSANDTYIARFVAAKSGTLVASHNIVQNATYTGTGTATIQAVVKNGATTVATLSSSDGSDIDLSSYIKSANSAYTIDITMTTTPTSGSDSRVAAFTSSSANYPGTTTSTLPSSSAVTFTVAQFTVQSILDSGVKALRYISYLDKTVYTYQYEITYNYTSRFWGAQSYKVTGTFANETIALANMDGTKNSAKLTTAFIQNQTPYEKNFRQTINWNYTTSAVGNAAAMVNNTATAVSGAENTYKLTATVYSANVVDDTVTAEFILPYKYGNQESGYTSAGVDVYTAADGNKVDGTSEIVFDESYESVQITKQVAHLFTYDNTSVTGSDSVRPSDVHLVEAAPYVIKGATNHTHKETVGRYFSGSHTVDGTTYAYFTVNNINYYYGSKPDSDATGVVLTASDTATLNGTTYTYAVKSGDTVYSFSDTTAAGNGQYRYYYLTDVVDGVVQNTGTKWYFTRWDIYDSDGDYVASSYHPRFNFSGYENYVVKPVYASETDTTSSNTDTSATITYLGDSRNQWNNGGSGNYASVTGKTDLTAADKLFADFAIAYNYNGQQIQTIESSDHEIKIGMVIEQVCAVDPGITDNTYYANLYKDDFNASAIKSALENNTSLKTATGHTTINSKIGANVSDWGTQFGADYTSPLGYPSVIDNFNRLQWFYTFNSSINGVDKTDDDYVYRASAYIIVDGTATVSSTPVYFNLYTTAKR